MIEARKLTEADHIHTLVFPDFHISKRKAKQKSKALGVLLAKFKVESALKPLPDESCDLCLSCSTINFDDIFHNQQIWTSLKKELETLEINPWHGVPVHVLPGMNSTMLESSCLCCRILATMVYGTASGQSRSEFVNPTWQLRAIAVLPGRRMPSRDTTFLHSDRIALFLTEHWEITHPSRFDWYISQERGWLMPFVADSWRSVSLDDDLPTRGYLFDNAVNHFRVQQLLDDCKTNHDFSCSKVTLGRPIDGRVIDCVERMVVPLTEEMEYIALSYVWGPQTLGSSTVSAGKMDETMQEVLPEEFPQCIEDGMEFVKRLNLRYLWVDRYYIQQVHATDKKFRIGQMSNIYGRAYATICALGPHDNHGLPGISRPRHSNHFSGRSGNIVIGKAASPARLKAYVNESSWSKR
jgi:hypothetical protein